MAQFSRLQVRRQLLGPVLGLQIHVLPKIATLRRRQAGLDFQQLAVRPHGFGRATRLLLRDGRTINRVVC